MFFMSAGGIEPIMNAHGIACSFLILMSVGACIAPIARSQQPPAPQPAALSAGEQEFFDAIRAGNSAKVSDLLKQQPALIKSHWKNGASPILFAVYANHPEIADALISTGIEPDIFEAAATGRIDRVRQLLKQDPNLIHAWSPDGWTALHLNFNHIDVAKLLIDSGADLNLNSRNALNATPLQGAAATNRLELARLYLERGANVNCRSAEGGSPLEEAAGSGYLDFAKLLIEKGANVNQKDDNGKTPLAIAIQYKQPEMAKFLREHGGVE
jgi:ankyrin repeat protein